MFTAAQAALKLSKLPNNALETFTATQAALKTASWGGLVR